MSATKKITSLVSRLQSNRGVQTRKDALRDFMNWFLTEKPELDSYAIKLLFSGDPNNGYSTGIIQFCGKQKNTENTSSSPSNGFAGYQYKESVKLALELWVSCIHESFGHHAKSFQAELEHIALGVYIQARLDIHIQIEEMTEYAGILIDAIIFATSFKLHEILPNEGAREAFKAWIKQKKGTEFKEDEDEEDDDDVIVDDSAAVAGNKSSKTNKKKKPTKWEDVKEEDLIVDDGNNEANDEWFQTLDFVGNKNNRNNYYFKQAADAVDDEDEEEDDETDDIFEDPLGQKKRYHVKKCVDRFNKKKKVFEDLQMKISNRSNDIMDNYYKFSPNINYDNFEATNFLVEIHNETDFESLQNGLDKIEKFVRDQSHKMKELVSEHFDEFVYCKDTIDSIHKMLSNTCIDDNNEYDYDMLKNTSKICKELDVIERDAVKIYGNVLARTKKAKVLYETLQLIKQPSFKFLFTLPQQIKYHIMMRNYVNIIRIYKRVHAQHMEHQMDGNQILNQILSQLNHTVQKLKENLLLKLSESHTFGDEEERIIFYLIELDCDINPAIYFLKQRHQYIVNKLTECEVNFSSNGTSAKKFIKRLCQIFISYIPSFWKLSKSILDNKFSKAVKSFKNEKIVKQLFGEITDKFIQCIKAAIDMTHKETMKLLLSAYAEIKSIKIHEHYILGIDALISETVQSFLNRLFEKSLNYILKRLSVEKWKPHRDIPGVTTTPLMFSDEISRNLQIVIDIGINIIYDADDEYANNHNIDDDINNNNNDDDDDDIDNNSDSEYIPFKHDRSSDSNDSNDSNLSGLSDTVLEYKLNALWLVPLIGSYFVEAHKLFADCLHELVYPNANAFNYNKKMNDKERSQDHKSKSKSKLNPLTHHINILSNYSDKSADKKLLYILGNTIYTKETILERIWTKYIKKSGIIGIEYMGILENSKNDLIDLYNSLEQMVFDKYVRCKTLLLNRVIDNSLLCDGINWETISEVKGIRDHCLQLLLHFVFIHNEVYNSSKQELDNVLISLLEKVSDHLLSTIKQIDSFSPSGALQILIEIDFIRNTLSKYLHPDGSQIVFQQIEQLLHQWMDQNRDIIKKRKEQLTLHTKQSTVVMFSCFSYDAKRA